MKLKWKKDKKGITAKCGPILVGLHAQDEFGWHSWWHSCGPSPDGRYVSADSAKEAAELWLRDQIAQMQKCFGDEQ